MDSLMSSLKWTLLLTLQQGSVRIAEIEFFIENCYLNATLLKFYLRRSWFHWRLSICLAELVGIIRTAATSKSSKKFVRFISYES
jgi:hypothetical protein